MDMLRVKRHKKTMTFQVYEDQLETLQKIAADTGLSQAEIVRQFIDRGIEEYEMERMKRRGRGRLWGTLTLFDGGVILKIQYSLEG